MDKQYRGSVIVINPCGILMENTPFVTGEEAKIYFLEACRIYISNFDEYSQEDIDYILEEGEERFGNIGLIVISWF